MRLLSLIALEIPVCQHHRSISSNADDDSKARIEYALFKRCNHTQDLTTFCSLIATLTDPRNGYWLYRHSSGRSFIDFDRFAKVTTPHRKSIQRKYIHLLRHLGLDASVTRFGDLECGSCGVLGGYIERSFSTCQIIMGP